LPASSATKPIFITEYANNIDSDADVEKGAQYVDWALYIQAHYPTVTRAYVYVISSQTTAENTSRQTIVRGGIVSQIADGIRDGGTLPPPPAQVREFDYWKDEDTGANLGKVNPLTIVVTTDRRIRAVTRPLLAVHSVEGLTDYGAVTGGGPYVAGTSASLRWLPT
jgi:hypothetical protein